MDLAFQTSCPEPIAVSVTTNEYTIENGSVTVTLSSAYTATTVAATLTATVSVESYFNVTLIFKDDESYSASATLAPPDVPGAGEVEITTDDEGVATLDVEYTGSLKTWYVYAVVNDRYSEPVTLIMGV